MERQADGSFFFYRTKGYSAALLVASLSAIMLFAGYFADIEKYKTMGMPDFLGISFQAAVLFLELVLFYLFFKALRLLFSKKPDLVIGLLGFEITGFPLLPWGHIENVRRKLLKTHKREIHVLSFTLKKGHEYKLSPFQRVDFLLKGARNVPFEVALLGYTNDEVKKIEKAVSKYKKIVF